MNEVIIENWNKTISDDDIIFILGDVCWGGIKEWRMVLERLAGRKILIQGNHDREKDIPTECFEHIVEGFMNIEVKDEKPQRITLCHYPMMSWLQSHKGAWNLFGHLHSHTIKPIEWKADKEEMEAFISDEYKVYKNLGKNQYDVGVDGNNFTPISYLKLKEIFKKRKDEDRKV